MKVAEAGVCFLQVRRWHVVVVATVAICELRGVHGAFGSNEVWGPLYICSVRWRRSLILSCEYTAHTWMTVVHANSHGADKHAKMFPWVLIRINFCLLLRLRKKTKLWRYQTCVLLSRSPWSSNTSEVHDNRSIFVLVYVEGRIFALIDLCIGLALTGKLGDY
jgi:hypothetical protein